MKEVTFFILFGALATAGVLAFSFFLLLLGCALAGAPDLCTALLAYIGAAS